MKTAVSRKNLWERLPPAVKKPVGLALSVAPPALLLGGRFRRWRRLVADADRWSADEVRRHQLQQLRSVLQLAGERSSYYRASFRSAGFDAALPNGVADLQKLPLIDKRTINEHADELLVVPRSSPGIDSVSTGGSSGEPLRFLIGAGRSAIEFAHLVSCWARVGYGLTSAQAVFRGQLIAPDEGGLRHEFDPLLRRHYYSTFHMDDASVGRYLAHVRSIGPCYLHMYPSAMNVLVRYLKRNGLTPPSNVQGLLIGSENVYEQDRRAAEAAFGVRYFTWYGHSEKLVMAAECERSCDYHVLPTYGYCELVDEGGRPVSRPGERGEIVGTGFLNRVMPFVRYRTGDYATYAGDHCEECGRQHLLLKDVRGHRTQEMLVARDGSLIPWTAVNTHEDTFDRVRQFQFAQVEAGRATLRIVPSGRPDEIDVEKVRRDMLARLQGQLDFDVQIVPEIRLTDRGKSVFVDQRLDVDEILSSGAVHGGTAGARAGDR
jgi:phenylacetate-CoA ligase